MSESQLVAKMIYAAILGLTGICLTPSGVVIACTPMQAASSHSIEACHDSIIALSSANPNCLFDATPSKEPASQTYRRNEKERRYSRARREQAVFQKAVLSHCRRFPGTRRHFRPEGIAKPCSNGESSHLSGTSVLKIETWRIRRRPYSIS